MRVDRQMLLMQQEFVALKDGVVIRVVDWRHVDIRFWQFNDRFALAAPDFATGKFIFHLEFRLTSGAGDVDRHEISNIFENV